MKNKITIEVKLFLNNINLQAGKFDLTKKKGVSKKMSLSEKRWISISSSDHPIFKNVVYTPKYTPKYEE